MAVLFLISSYLLLSASSPVPQAPPNLMRSETKVSELRLAYIGQHAQMDVSEDQPTSSGKYDSIASNLQGASLMHKNAEKSSALLASGDVTEMQKSDCIKCPTCLQHLHPGCLNHDVDFLRPHRDCSSGNPLCSRGVWECPAAGFFFTYPTVTPAEITEMYKNSYSDQKQISDGTDPRIEGQYAYIDKHILSNPNVKPRRLKTVVEVGCAAGFLSSKLAAPDRNMVCFEPDPDYAKVAEKHLLAAGFASVNVIAGPFDPEKLPTDGVDLFVSSHVLEHMPDLCGFLSELHNKMNPGAAIFSEVPNHTREYLMNEFGGQFHISFPTERGFLNIMEANDFKMVAMDLFAVGDEKNTKGGGAHIRSVFIKPSKYEHGGLGWTPGDAGK